MGVAQYNYLGYINECGWLQGYSMCHHILKGNFNGKQPKNGYQTVILVVKMVAINMISPSVQISD